MIQEKAFLCRTYKKSYIMVKLYQFEINIIEKITLVNIGAC